MCPVDVSIVIVNWNARHYLLQCLESIYTTTRKCSFEVIVVDNASTDGSTESLMEKFPQIRLTVNRENLGFAKANNIGIMQSTGRYICLSNSDISVLDDCLDRIVDFMDQNPRAGVVGPKTLNGDGSLRHNCQHFPSLWNLYCRAVYLHRLFPRRKLFNSGIMYYFDHQSVMRCQVLPCCFYMVRREALEDVGLLDERFFIYAEDKDWCKRFWDKGWEIVFLPTAEVIHYAGKSSANAPIRFQVEKLKADLQYWKKHHSRICLLFLYAILLLHHGIRIAGWSFSSLLRPSLRHSLSNRIAASAASIRFLFTHHVPS
jgi:GT2 family glycosyltransferase